MVYVCVLLNCLRTHPETSMEAGPVVNVASVLWVGPFPQASDERTW